MINYRIMRSNGDGPGDGSGGGTEERNYRYSEKENIDLLGGINYNNNPYDIIVEGNLRGSQLYKQWAITTTRWRSFINFIKKETNQIPKDQNGSVSTIINSKDYDYLTNSLIDEFNGKYYGKNRDRPILAPIFDKKFTVQEIKNIQKFNQITDASIIEDGRIGTQTLRLIYPIWSTFSTDLRDSRNGKIIFNKRDTKEDPIDIRNYHLYPVLIGNKRFVIEHGNYPLNEFRKLWFETYKNVDDLAIRNSIFSSDFINILEEKYGSADKLHNIYLANYLKIYNPNQDFDLITNPSLQRSFKPAWVNASNNATPTLQPQQVNDKTKIEQSIKNAKQNTTNIIKNITK